MYRLWVDPPVELGERRDVAREHARAAHDHAALHPAGELRLNANGDGKIGEWPKCNELQLAWLFTERLNHGVDSVATCCFAALERQPDVAHAVSAVHMLRGGEGANERHLCTGMYRDALAAQFSRVEGILHAELHRNVADHNRHADDFGVRMLERHDDRHDVI